jgi:ribulose-5-phosphate 4-epimerase/fuculose-1-phosphate aldolase
VNDERHQRIRQLALGYRVFGALRWGDAGDGHISARDPDRTDCFWMLRYGVSFDRATSADMVLVGPDGEVVEGDGRVNRAGFSIHAPILEARPDVVSAAHTHTPWGTPFSAEARLLEPITQEACYFQDDHALFDDDEVQILGLEGGKRIAVSLGTHRGIVLRNHGLLTVGRDVREAVAAFVMMERVAEAHLKALHARPIPAAAARVAKVDLQRDDGLARAFDWLVARHVPDPAVVA